MVTSPWIRGSWYHWTYLLTVVVVLTAATPAGAQPPEPTPLKNLVDEQVVAKVGYCKGEYTLTMANGVEHRYPEFNLRFKTDSS